MTQEIQVLRDRFRRVGPGMALAVTFALAWLAAPCPAQAYEDQVSLGIGAGYAHAVSDHQPEHGALVLLDGSLGLDDIWTVRAQLGFAYHPDRLAPLSMFLASSELIYMIDVFELVPYVGAGIDGLGALRSSKLEVDFGVHPVLGIDWLPARDLVLGFAARPIFLLSGLDHDPVYVTFSVTAALLFDL